MNLTRRSSQAAQFLFHHHFKEPFVLSFKSDSNQRPTHYKCVALPTELLKQTGGWSYRAVIIRTLRKSSRWLRLNPPKGLPSLPYKNLAPRYRAIARLSKPLPCQEIAFTCHRCSFVRTPPMLDVSTCKYRKWSHAPDETNARTVITSFGDIRTWHRYAHGPVIPRPP